MNTKNIKKWIWLTAMLIAAISVNAQTKPAGKVTDDTDYNSSFDIVHNDNGNTVEKMQLRHEGKLYRAVLVNSKMTELYIDGEKIPAADWSKHQDAIDLINDQLARNREQAKRNAEQAKRNELQAEKNKEQAKRNEEQAARNKEQEKRNVEQAERNREQEAKNHELDARNEEQVKLNKIQDEKNEVQAKRNEEQAARNKEQEKRNAEQAVKNQDQAARNEEQARLNKEQETRNAEQAVRNKEQEARNAEQAERNKAQAEANERFIKSITSDLVADKIIPDVNSLRGLTFNQEELIVNGVKQPDEVFKKYAAKYSGTVKGSFSFSEDTVPGN